MPNVNYMPYPTPRKDAPTTNYRLTGTRELKPQLDEHIHQFEQNTIDILETMEQQQTIINELKQLLSETV